MFAGDIISEIERKKNKAYPMPHKSAWWNELFLLTTYVVTNNVIII